MESVPTARGRRALRVLGLAGAAALLAARPFVAFLPAVPRASAPPRAPPRVAPEAAAPSATLGEGSRSPASSSGVAAFGAWAAAAALASLGRSTARRAAAEETKTETEAKEPFDVWKPDTYGNITMDDVKKYGAAGTLSYVITELIFWAIAFPTEIGVFYQTAGRWPDFSNDMDKAAVLGFVFAASNIARLVLPLRFGAALAMAPWVDENIMSKLPGASAKA